MSPVHLRRPIRRQTCLHTAAALRAVLATLASAAVLAGCGPASPGATPQAASPASVARRTAGTAADSFPGGATAARGELDSLPVAAARPMKGYSRDRFPHWASQGDGCDTRDLVLERDGTNVRVTDACKITSGRWTSPYDGKTFTVPQQLDIDHMVPLANAWRSGADAWDDPKRGTFANDLARPQLLAVSTATNRAKGDQDPSLWLPPDRGYWCQYAERWIAVKGYWRLTVTSREKSKLLEILGGCP